MSGFLGPAAFVGSSIDARTARPSFVGEATFTGHIAFANWARDEVATLLPPELTLAGQLSGAADLHPVAFIFGAHAAGGLIFAGLRLPMNIRYYELGMAIPFVHHRSERQLHTFVARMYAGYFPATWNGNAHYGMAKEMADLAWQPPIFTVAAPGGQLLFHAAVEPAGDWAAGPDPGIANFAAVRTAFALPIIGRKANGTYACSYFGWDFAAASVRSARCALSIDAALIPQLAARRCHAVAGGTFEVLRMRWRLSWPVPCRD